MSGDKPSIRLLLVGGVDFIPEIVVNLLLDSQIVALSMHGIVIILMCSLTWFDFLEDMVNRLLYVARHLIMARCFLI